jgi:hydrogenase nickel incorporation protein HypA/HybF
LTALARCASHWAIQSIEFALKEVFPPVNEISTARHLLTKLEAESWKHGLTGISRVHVRMGALCDIMPDTLTSAFQTVADGTVASGAELNIRLVAPKGLCEKCGNGVPVARRENRPFRCVQCGRDVCKFTSGRELDVVLIRGKIRKPSWPGLLKQPSKAIASHGLPLQDDMGKYAPPKADSV